VEISWALSLRFRLPEPSTSQRKEQPSHNAHPSATNTAPTPTTVVVYRILRQTRKPPANFRIFDPSSQNTSRTLAESSHNSPNSSDEDSTTRSTNYSGSILRFTPIASPSRGRPGPLSRLKSAIASTSLTRKSLWVSTVACLVSQQHQSDSRVLRINVIPGMRMVL
jgi:hypothetical protein